MEQSTVFAAIVGEPNVGKSTLINQLVGAKIAITANRPQTTRTRILGVITKGETQYVFTDTPGFHAPKNRLDEHMVKSVRNGYGEVDVILFTVFPSMMMGIARFMGIYSPVNMIFFLGFIFLAAIAFSMTVALSRLSASQRRLAQENALWRYEKEAGRNAAEQAVENHPVAEQEGFPEKDGRKQDG